MTQTTNQNSNPGALKTFFLRLYQHPLLAALMLFVLFGSLGLGFFIYQEFMLAHSNKVATIEATNYSNSLAQEVNRFITEKQHNLNSFANRKTVIDAFADSDRIKVNQLESLVAMLSRDIMEGQLLFPNDQRLDQTRNFAAREMFFQAMNGENPAPTAVRLEQGWALLLVFAIPNPDNNQAMGALVASISLASLNERLSNTGAPGTVSLVQTLPGIAPQKLLTTPISQPTHIQTESPTNLPYWKINFTANQNLVAGSTPTLTEIAQLFTFTSIVGLLLAYLIARPTFLKYKNDPLPQFGHKKKTAIAPQNANAESFLQSIPQANTKDEPTQKEKNPKPEIAEERKTQKKPPSTSYPEHIFREYDIRGVYNEELTTDLAKQLGRVVGSKAQAEGEHSIITAYDGRISSPALCKALEQGILSTGCNVIQVGQVPTPILNFATQHIDQSSFGIMVTASHNPANYNGFKITRGNRSLTSEEVQELKQAMEANDFKQGLGEKSSVNIAADYKEAITLDIIPATELKLVIDAGNGIAGNFAPDIMEALGCTVIPLHCEVDGSFPNHEADTTKVSNLKDLINAVKEHKADLGIGLDGDGDRLVAITDKGEIVWPDQLMMIFARDIISREPGADIIFDIKSTRRLNALISSYGGRPVMWKTGHSNIRNKTLENNAPLGGEYSGHIFFRDRWHGFDDGIYAAARLIEIMSTREQSLEEIVSSFEASYSTPEIKVSVPDQDKFNLVERFAEVDDFGEASVSRIDGIRVDLPDSWGLLRASNTTPALTLRFEATSAEELEIIQSMFRQRLQGIDSQLTF